MSRRRKRAPRRNRVGRVSYFYHHSSWYVSFRDGARQVRRRIGPDESQAAQVRQITLGHAPSAQGNGGLGMTAAYTHTRAETQKREIVRAVRLWPLALQIAREWLEGLPS